MILRLIAAAGLVAGGVAVGGGSQIANAAPCGYSESSVQAVYVNCAAHAAYIEYVDNGTTVETCVPSYGTKILGPADELEWVGGGWSCSIPPA